MSSSGTAICAARQRSGRWVIAAPISRPPLLPPRMASRSRRREAGVDQPVGGGDEVVEGLLLVLAHAGAVPGLALLGAAADVGDGVDAAVVAHRHDRRAVGRAHRDAEAAVAGEDARRVRATAWSRRPDQEHRDLGAVGARVANLLDDVVAVRARRGRSSCCRSRLQSAMLLGRPAVRGRRAGEGREREERLLALAATGEAGQRAELGQVRLGGGPCRRCRSDRGATPPIAS